MLQNTYITSNLKQKKETVYPLELQIVLKCVWLGVESVPYLKFLLKLSF